MRCVNSGSVICVLRIKLCVYAFDLISYFFLVKVIKLHAHRQAVDLLC